MKRDIWKHEQRYKQWKEDALDRGVDKLTKKNSDILIKYLSDMEIGINVSNKNKRGARSFIRLNTLRQRLSQIMRMMQERKVNDLTAVKEKEIIQLFADMRSGILKTKEGTPYRSASDYAKVFTAFWHWYQKVNKKANKKIEDITEEIDKRKEKGRFVYITKEQLEEMLPYFPQDEQLYLEFVFDSIIRAPGELLSITRKDIYEKNGNVWVHVPKEVSKTNFERDFNLLYCGGELMKYIERKNLKPDDYLFNFDHILFTAKFQKVAKQLFGDKISHPKAGGSYSEIILYDLRHSGAIHLRVLAAKTKKISLDAIRQRGGWVDFEMLNYYTQFIGLTGEIDKEDLLIEEDKSKLQKDLDTERNARIKLEKTIAKYLPIFKALDSNSEAIELLQKNMKK